MIPIVDYVSPSVWAWRPARAREMRAYVDHVLALLPFEPEVHQRLGGPPCTYVGHPLIERGRMPAAGRPEPSGGAADPPSWSWCCPGSRRAESSATCRCSAMRSTSLVATLPARSKLVLPTVPHLGAR